MLRSMCTLRCSCRWSAFVTGDLWPGVLGTCAKGHYNISLLHCMHTGRATSLCPRVCHSCLLPSGRCVWRRCLRTIFLWRVRPNLQFIFMSWSLWYMSERGWVNGMSVCVCELLEGSSHKHHNESATWWGQRLEIRLFDVTSGYQLAHLFIIFYVVSCC